MNILTTDFHTHILPGIDDGSQSVEDAAEMLHKEQLDGVSTIIMTPHFYPHMMYPESFLENRKFAIEKLRDSWPDDSEMPDIILGAEVQFCPGMSQWEQLDALTIGDTGYILIEMPFVKWNKSVYDELEKIYFNRGLTPIIAHIERYFGFFNMRKVLNKLFKIPVMLQMNCEFITDKRTQRVALRLIAEQKIHFIGSDCHRPGWRAPIMAEARNVLLDNLDQQALSFLANNESIVVQKQIP